MSPLFAFLQLNDIVATVCGFCLSLTLLIMILTEKNGELRGISRVLIQNCVLDCIFSISCFLTFPQNYTHNGVHYLMVTGFMRGFPNRNVGTFLIDFYVTCLGTSVFIIPIPFYMRYLIICKGKTEIMKPMIICYVLVFPLIITTAWIMLNAYPMDTVHNTVLANALNNTFWVEEFGLVPIFAANYIRTWQVTLVFIWGTVTFFISYAIVIYLTTKMQKEIKIKTQMTSISSLNLQVQKVLILQAVGPFVTAVIPMGILSIIVLPDLNQDLILLSCATTFVWISGINAIVALFIVRPYRRRILRKLCFFRENMVIRSSVHYVF